MDYVSHENITDLMFDINDKKNPIISDITTVLEDCQIYQDSDESRYVLISESEFTSLCNLVTGKYKVLSSHVERLKRAVQRRSKSRSIKIKSVVFEGDYWKTVFTLPMTDNFFEDFGDDDLNEIFRTFYNEHLTTDKENLDIASIDYNYVARQKYQFDIDKGVIYGTLSTEKAPIFPL